MWLAGTSLIVFCLFGSLFGGLFDRVFQNRTAATIFVFALAVAFAFVQFKLFTGDIQKQGRLEYEYREHLFAAVSKQRFINF